MGSKFMLPSGVRWLCQHMEVFHNISKAMKLPMLHFKELYKDKDIESRHGMPLEFHIHEVMKAN